MHSPKRALLAVSAVFVLLPHSPAAAQKPSDGTVRVRVEMLKPSTFERKSGAGPVLIGPQSALELEWRVTNQTGGPPREYVVRLNVHDLRQISASGMMYGELGRHREACAVFRKIMPDLIRLPDSPLARHEPQIVTHLRAAPIHVT